MPAIVFGTTLFGAMFSGGSYYRRWYMLDDGTGVWTLLTNRTGVWTMLTNRTGVWTEVDDYGH